MKEKTSKLIEVFMANKAKAIVLGVATVVAVTGTVAGACVIAKNRGGAPVAPTTSETSKLEVAEVTSSETSETESAEVEEVVSTTSEPTSSKTTPSANTTPQTQVTTNSTTSSSEPSGTRTFVQPADPNTGISWDGVSPIIYTYPDGTTGTEPRVGATYEAMPGITGTIYAPIEPEEYDGRCPDCGKVEGDGTNGTCLQYWAGGGANCDHCGEFVPEDTCHTCGE